MRLISALIVVIYGCVDHSLAQNHPDATSRIAELEKRIEVLEAENAMLRAELKAIRESSTAAVNTEELTETDDRDTDIAARRKGQKRYTTAMQILNELPADLQPHPKDGWNKFQDDDLKEWFSTAAVGAQFETNLKLNRVRVDKRIYTGDPPDGNAWTAHFQYVSKTYPYLAGMTIRETLRSSSIYSISVDDAMAQRLEKLKPGLTCKVTGTIRSIRLTGDYTPDRKRVEITLEDATVIGPGFRIEP